MIEEFKKFIKRGNVLDLAVGVIIGAAFGKIVTSTVEDLVMPVLSLILGKVDFSNYFIALNGATYPTLAAAKQAGAATINYGNFLNAVIQFLIIAVAVFLLVRQVNRFLPPPPLAAPSTKDCPECFTKIPIPARRCPACTSVLA
jgi:large conductance mechanosensitive channel